MLFNGIFILFLTNECVIAQINILYDKVYLETVNIPLFLSNSKDDLFG
jgi:hypothetical protein